MSRAPSRLPAAPLAAVIDRMLAYASDIEGVNDLGRRAMVYQQIGTDPRVVADWRNLPRRRVDFATADRVLTATPYLWFDVWHECDHGPAHHSAMALDGKCETCETFYRARFVFTGVRPPRKRRKRAWRPPVAA